MIDPMGHQVLIGLFVLVRMVTSAFTTARALRGRRQTP